MQHARQSFSAGGAGQDRLVLHEPAPAVQAVVVADAVQGVEVRVEVDCLAAGGVPAVIAAVERAHRPGIEYERRQVEGDGARSAMEEIQWSVTERLGHL